MILQTIHYPDWLEEIQKITTMHSRHYRQAYEEGLTPEEAVEFAIEQMYENIQTIH